MTRRPIRWTERAYAIAGWFVFAGLALTLPVLTWITR